MPEPTTYTAALLLMLVSMLCWGSWASTQKVDAAARFQLFYVDYTLALVVTACLGGVWLGNLDAGSPLSFWHNLHAAAPRALAEAFAGGLIFSAGNLLLTAAIAVAGMSVAFPVGSGLGLVIGVVLNYLIAPAGNPLLIFAGVALVLLAIVLDALAYRAHQGTASGASASTGIWLSIGGGLGAGLFYPPVAASLKGAGHLTPYTVDVVFALGALVSMVPAVTLLLLHSPQDAPSSWREYGRMSLSSHAWAWLGGLVWGVGTLANFVASYVPLIGPATSFAMGEGNSMISAVWGVFVFREFAGASTKARVYLWLMFVCFAAGLTAIALAPLMK